MREKVSAEERLREIRRKTRNKDRPLDEFHNQGLCLPCVLLAIDRCSLWMVQ